MMEYMEYEKTYEALPTALRQWCDRAASGAAEDDRYLVQQKAAQQAYRCYTALCADHDPKLAEVTALNRLVAPYDFATRRARKRARVFLIAAIVAAVILVVVDVVAATALVPSAWLNLTSAGGAKLAGELAATNVATIVLVVILAASAVVQRNRGKRPPMAPTDAA
ncbi:MAG: hypothetical protein LUG45_05170 [Clostridiales bacterium]|nr:hypothetical protein [Clostridiales bacterium]